LKRAAAFNVGVLLSLGKAAWSKGEAMLNDKLRQALNLMFALAQPIVAVLVNTGATGPSIGEVSNRYPTYVVPAGYAFMIWNLIFALSLGYGIWQALPAQRENKLLRRVGWWTAPALAATSLWTLVFQRSLFGLSLLVMAGLLIVLSVVAVRMARYARGFTFAEQWLVYVNFSVFLGWITVASVANVGQVLTAYEWSGWGAQTEMWGIVALLAAGIIASAVTVALKGNLPYAVAAMWGLIGVAVNQFARSGSIEPNTVGAVAIAVTSQVAFTLLFTRQERNVRPRSRHNTSLST
jgi:hypothetical protein